MKLFSKSSQIPIIPYHVLQFTNAEYSFLLHDPNIEEIPFYRNFTQNPL